MRPKVSRGFTGVVSVVAGMCHGDVALRRCYLDVVLVDGVLQGSLADPLRDVNSDGAGQCHAVSLEKF